MITLTLTQARANRAIAVTQGQRTYHGQPCAKGHGGERYTSGSQCVACAAALRTQQAERVRAKRLAQGQTTRKIGTPPLDLRDTSASAQRRRARVLAESFGGDVVAFNAHYAGQ